MTKDEMTTLLRGVCVKEETIDAMLAGYDAGWDAMRDAVVTELCHCGLDTAAEIVENFLR